MANIGKITRISVRDEFPDEARNFTPWLKENLHHIGEKLDLNFLDAQTEVSVGRYSCDILAHDSDERRIVIENQFGNADHDHLGKILTYAAGLEADILIWIAEDFLPEHIAALNWLNSIASEEDSPSFFALKINLIKIDDSNPALEVNPIVRPDQWTRQEKVARISREKSDKAKKYNEFWTHFIPYFDSVKPGFKNRTPPYDSWINFPSAKPGLQFTFYFWKGKYPTISLGIVGGTKDENKKTFEKLQTHQSELNSKFPELDWYDNPGNKSKSIEYYIDKEYDFSEENRKDVMEWFSKNMQAFESTFNPIIQNL
ncbi:MAG: DUF4268 domain-containing protein [Nitrosarchaeum sp.]|uniref:DUF4268 domain-containing protein n=1 Tax=Nitrosarchaeum sp. TaxID=2026886 RepID=UPI002DE39C0E|nr:DUF4268 domain-containing protein [Nitrosarchaeum sp.]